MTYNHRHFELRLEMTKEKQRMTQDVSNSIIMKGENFRQNVISYTQLSRQTNIKCVYMTKVKFLNVTDMWVHE